MREQGWDEEGNLCQVPCNFIALFRIHSLFYTDLPNVSGGGSVDGRRANFFGGLVPSLSKHQLDYSLALFLLRHEVAARVDEAVTALFIGVAIQSMEPTQARSRVEEQMTEIVDILQLKKRDDEWDVNNLDVRKSGRVASSSFS